MIERLNEIGIEYINYLWSQYQYDMSIMSNQWMYWPLMIPIFFYCVFFMAKWALMTIPIWILPSYLFGGVHKFVKEFLEPIKDIVNGKTKKEK